MNDPEDLKTRLSEYQKQVRDLSTIIQIKPVLEDNLF